MKTGHTWKILVLLNVLGISPVFSLEEAQDYLFASISGKIMDQETKRPILGAVVKLELEGQILNGATTASDGSFLFNKVNPGKKQINASLLEYTSFTKEIDLEAGASYALDIRLLSQPITLRAVKIIGESAQINRKITGTVAKLEARTVAQIQPLGTQELLEMVPGVNGYADDGFGNSRLGIGIRGLNPRRSSRVLLLEDGVSIQPAVYIYSNAYYNPPAERIDAVEVIKGSAAIRFGPQTMGGVINYTTRRPAGLRHLANQLTVGTNGYYSLFSEWRGLGREHLTLLGRPVGRCLALGRVKSRIFSR
jgi:Fe(3+) dicitrate transport protein